MNETKETRRQDAHKAILSAYVARMNANIKANKEQNERRNEKL
jgi:hypothetical protein